MLRRALAAFLIALPCLAHAGDGATFVAAPSGDIPVKRALGGASDDGQGATLEGGVRALAFSQDGSRIAVGTEDGAVWVATGDPASWKLAHRHDASVAAVAFLGSQVLSASDDGTIVATLDDATAPAFPVGIGPLTAATLVDATLVVGSSRGGLAFIKVGRDLAIERTIEGVHEGGVSAIVALGKDRVATAGADGQVKVIDLASGKTLHAQRVSQLELASLAASADGKLLAASAWDGPITLLDARTLRPVGKTFEAHPGVASCCLFSGKWLLTASLAEEAVAASSPQADGFQVAHTSHPGAVPTALALSRDGKSLACGTSAGTVIVYDVEAFHE